MKDTPTSPDDATLPDHESDGIREEDNPMPRWWVGILIVMLLFTVIYVPVVHIFNMLPQQELQTSMTRATRAQEQRELALEASGALDKDPVAAGQKYFKTFCASCHGQNAEGSIGPNLTDAFWIHGPLEDSIRATIANGVAAKGMPAWGPILGERKVKSIAVYVTTLWKSPQPGKKPEGVQYDMAAIREGGAERTAETDSAKVHI